MSEKQTEEKSKEEKLSDKLFLLYSLTMQHESSELARSQFKGITTKDLHLIHAISLDENQTITQVAKKMALTKGTLTSNVDKLEYLGYIERHRSTKDRRVINLSLTKKGKLLYRLRNREHNEFVNIMLDGLSEKERADVNNAVDRLIKYLEEAENKNK
ncbi:MarR family winged helix-turn-helix transcriptional regulator [Ligilactobacillus sp. LYQ135]